LVFPADHTFPAILLLFLQILNKTQLWLICVKFWQWFLVTDEGDFCH
jgi:hypothetical protein